jgi:hypothetical protein
LSHGQDFGDAVSGGVRAGRDLVNGIVAAVSGKILEGRLRGQENNIEKHFDKLGSPNQPGGEDPNTRDKWKRDIQKGLREMRKLADRLKGKDAQKWDDRIRTIEERLSKVE